MATAVPREGSLAAQGPNADIIITSRVHIVVLGSLTVLWAALFAYFFQSPVVALEAFILIVLSYIIRHLYVTQYLNDDQFYVLMVLSYWVMIFLSIATTGGVYSPFFSSLVSVCSLSLNIVPQSNRTSYPVVALVVLSILVFSAFEYMSNPFPQFFVAHAWQANALCLASVSLGVVTRGNTFRGLLRDALRKEQLAHDSKSRFMAHVSHEIRTPLTTIVGWAELLQRDTLPTKVRGAIDTIRSSSGTLLSIINDLLDYSKMENHKLTLERLPFDLREFVQNLGESTRVLFKPGVDFRVKINLSNVHYVLGDAHRLAQCANNVLSNAAKFTHYGKVTFTVSEGEVLREGVAVTFIVRDTGIGMRKETLSRLFQPFAQADTSTARKFGGTGLGLNITRQLVELMGGSIHVESTLNEGSSFTWTVPLTLVADVEDVQRISPAHDEPQRPVGLRVLLAEDNAMNRSLIVKFLKECACKVVEAVDGREAVQIAGTERFDIILMDVQMPEMDGIEATRMLRASGSASAIVGLTASADELTVSEATKAGMDGVLSKPFSLKELRAALGRYARQSTS